MRNVLLINLGGPRNKHEIEKFLLDLFLDPYVFDLPLPEYFRKKLACFIAKKRVSKVEETYNSMGFENGGSPLVKETEKQAVQLEKKLNLLTNGIWKVRYTMACGYPNILEENLENLIPSKEQIIFPLFPHSSRSTTLSIAKIIEKKTSIDPTNNHGWIRPFYKNQSYLHSVSKLIIDYFKGNLLKKDFLHLDNMVEIPDWKNIPILFSAHGIPLRLVKKGDTYVQEIEENIHLLKIELRNMGHSGEIYHSFQSRVGPTKWTEPNTINMLENLGKVKKIKRLAIYPISFISDHLETLEEIGVQFRGLAKQNGIVEFYRIPAPSCYQPFIDALAQLIIKESNI